MWSVMLPSLNLFSSKIKFQNFFGINTIK
jgi:hypothetical protein